MWKNITFENREDALKAEKMLSSLSLKGCLDTKIKYFGVGNPGDSYDDETYLRTLSIKIEE